MANPIPQAFFTRQNTVVRITIQEAEAETCCRQGAFYRKEEQDSDTTAF